MSTVEYGGVFRERLNTLADKNDDGMMMITMMMGLTMMTIMTGMLLMKAPRPSTEHRAPGTEHHFCS